MPCAATKGAPALTAGFFLAASAYCRHWSTLGRGAGYVEFDVRQHRQHAVAHFLLEAVHDRQHHDQGGDAQRDARHRTRGDEGDEAIAAAASLADPGQPGIAGADPEFVGYFQHERIMALTARKSGPRMCGSKTRRIHLWQMAAGLSSRHRQTTIPPMLIVIPGALPALPVAAELAAAARARPRVARLAAGRRARRTLRPARARLHRLRSLAAAPRRPPARGRPAPGRRPGPC